jgi:hypothetical protein
VVVFWERADADVGAAATAAEEALLGPEAVCWQPARTVTIREVAQRYNGAKLSRKCEFTGPEYQLVTEFSMGWLCRFEIRRDSRLQFYEGLLRQALRGLHAARTPRTVVL